MPGYRLSSAAVVRTIVTLLDRAGEHTPLTAQQAAVARIDRLPVTPDDEVQFSLKRLAPGLHPLAFLAGFVAPPTWAGIGVIAHGRARHADDPSVVLGRARVISVLIRDGTFGSLLRMDGAEPQVTVEPAGSGVLGEIPLALCRALGVPFRGRPGDLGAPEGDME